MGTIAKGDTMIPSFLLALRIIRFFAKLESWPKENANICCYTSLTWPLWQSFIRRRLSGGKYHERRKQFFPARKIVFFLFFFKFFHSEENVFFPGSFFYYMELLFYEIKFYKLRIITAITDIEKYLQQIQHVWQIFTDF